MKPNIFISYSRREVGFVDQLANHLEKEGHTFWLDYRSLVPGQPWEEQIYQGIMNANIVLLVVSKASLASNNVEYEWRRVLKDTDKRTILLIFEAVDLPPELEKFEWVDFRGNYQSALKELDRQIQMEEEEEHPVPQTGFKVPFIVWLSFGLSIITAILSIGAAWTLFVPFFLLPLPYRIFKRSFNYPLVQASLIMLPIALFIISDFSTDVSTMEIAEVMSMLSLPFVLGLVFALRSSAMQRWGKPEAISPVSFPHWNDDNSTPKPISFHIDNAPEDGIVANELRTSLTANGHIPAADVKSAEATFALISAYKADSDLDCEKHVIFPVILQTNNKISAQLSKIQWMDLRLGFQNIDAIGRLADKPEKLLKALCVRPMGNQLILPRIIMYLIYFIAFLAIVDLGSWIPYIIQYLPDVEVEPMLDGPLFQLVLSLVLFGVLSFFMIRQIVARKGFFASYPGLILGMVIFGLIIYWQGNIDAAILDVLVDIDDRGLSSYYPEYLYQVGGLFMLVYLFFKRKGLRRWLPAR